MQLVFVTFSQTFEVIVGLNLLNILADLLVHDEQFLSFSSIGNQPNQVEYLQIISQLEKVAGVV